MGQQSLNEIDWFAVGFQILNVILFVWLIGRLLYKPVSGALNVRIEVIAKELTDADEKASKEQEELDAFERRKQECDRNRAALLAKATEEANAELLRLAGAARPNRLRTEP